MNGHTPRPGDIAAAAVVIGGILVIAFPQYALSTIQVVIVTLAVVSGLYALALNVPPTGWLSPFKWLSPFGRSAHLEKGGSGPEDIDLLRSKLGDWRQPIHSGPPMPAETLRLLKPLIRATLDLDPDDEPPPPSARALVSPLTWAVLTSDPPTHSYWFQRLPPNRREVAEAVHGVLDDLERFAAGTGIPRPPTDTGEP